MARRRDHGLPSQVFHWTILSDELVSWCFIGRLASFPILCSFNACRLSWLVWSVLCMKREAEISIEPKHFMCEKTRPVSKRSHPSRRRGRATGSSRHRPTYRNGGKSASAR
jgi:hypothetical protein